MLGLGRHLLYSTRDYHDEVTWWYFLIPVSYAFGIFPTAQLVAGLLGHDPTEEGSGNPGASNVYRVAGAKAGILVLAGDLMKGFTQRWCAISLMEDFWFAGGCCCHARPHIPSDQRFFWWQRCSNARWCRDRFIPTGCNHRCCDLVSYYETVS